MASSPPPFPNSLTLIIPNRHQLEDEQKEEEEEESPYSTPIFRPTPRRTPSFSSESSSESLFSSNDNSYPPCSPSTPLKSKLGIPFSWEQIPGLPKHKESKSKKEYSEHLLPPPPARNSLSRSSGKKSHHHHPTDVVTSLQRDPFFAALVKCSKDDHGHNNNNNNNDHGTNFGNIVCSKITRTFSDRFGLVNLYAASCKRTCSVSESIACLPRSSPHYLMHNNRR